VMLGINQRNLQTLAVDPRYAETLAASLPKGTRFVVESGIKSSEDLRWAKGLGAAGVLVGEALARAADPGQELLGWLRACS
jgi:indole-3-glycerol phosphate synthase